MFWSSFKPTIERVCVSSATLRKDAANPQTKQEKALITGLQKKLRNLAK
jgi:hypothetical protein